MRLHGRSRNRPLPLMMRRATIDLISQNQLTAGSRLMGSSWRRRPGFGRRPRGSRSTPGPFKPPPNYDPSPEASLAAPPSFSRRKQKKATRYTASHVSPIRVASPDADPCPMRCHSLGENPTSVPPAAAQQQHATTSSVLFRCWRGPRSLQVSGSNRALADSSHSLSVPPPCGSVDSPTLWAHPPASCLPPLQGPD